MPYDLECFTDLNRSWASRPLVPEPPRQDPVAMADRARGRLQRMAKQLALEPGHRVLEIGCGRGHLSRQLASEAAVESVGLDIHRYPEWIETTTPGATFIAGDISEPLGLDGTFDRIFSLSVWEHLEHPSASLEQTYRLLKPGGVMFIQAQLLHGPKASHRYREVFFPWPHLLFRPDVFEEYYISIGREPMRPAFVNGWTAMHYQFHLERVGFESLWFSTPQPWFDRQFYDDHREQLGLYPIWDLSHDVIMIRVRRPEANR
jgi:ubiquinone/menaquinone biosynthesis C-methylase UbiE